MRLNARAHQFNALMLKIATKEKVMTFKEIDEPIVSMIEFQGRIIVATSFNLYEFKDDCLFKIKVQVEAGGPSTLDVARSGYGESKAGGSLLAVDPRDRCGDYDAQGKA